MKGYKNQHEWGVVGQCHNPYREFAYCPLCDKYDDYSGKLMTSKQFKTLVSELSKTDNPIYDADSQTLYLDGRGQFWNKDRKYYQGLAGYKACRKNKITKGYNVLYDAEKQGLDSDGGKWATVCEVHGEICNHEDLITATYFLPNSLNWCQTCRDYRARLAEKEINCPFNFRYCMAYLNCDECKSLNQQYSNRF